MLSSSQSGIMALLPFAAHLSMMLKGQEIAASQLVNLLGELGHNNIFEFELPSYTVYMWRMVTHP